MLFSSLVICFSIVLSGCLLKNYKSEDVHAVVLTYLSTEGEAFAGLF